MYKETQNGVPSAMNPHCSEVRSSPSKLKVNRMHIAAPEALASSQIKSRYTRPEEGPGTPTGATPTLSVGDTASVRLGARSANQFTGRLNRSRLHRRKPARARTAHPIQSYPRRPQISPRQWPAYWHLIQPRCP